VAVGSIDFAGPGDSFAVSFVRETPTPNREPPGGDFKAELSSVRGDRSLEIPSSSIKLKEPPESQVIEIPDQLGRRVVARLLVGQGAHSDRGPILSIMLFQDV
jgi:hypothetical protein